MVSINYSAREVCCKIVYYGPGLSGKTTNLQYVHSKVPGNTRGDLISLATEADRTLYFDFLPINIGSINGFAAKFQLYTVPGQVYYNATRKLVLRGVDGVVFVADSQPDKMDENIESLMNLEDNLKEYGYDMNTMPVVIQYNKRDLPGVLPVEEIHQRLNSRGWPHFEASATVGNGVFDTLKLIIKLVLDKAKSGGTTPSPTISEPVSAAKPSPPPMAIPEPVAPAAAPIPVPTAKSPTAEQPSFDEPLMSRQDAAKALAASVISEPAARSVPEQMADKPVAISSAVEENKVDYRPYPGDAGLSSPEESSPEVQPVSPSEDVDERNVVKPETETIEKTLDVKDDSDRESENLSSPSMAPSLKRHKPERKRGFFKRLFGIK